MKSMRKALFVLFLALFLSAIVMPALADVTVYITNSGKKYHVDGCRYLKSKTPVSLADAKAQGYEACSVCSPPR
ncbi:MAG: hypothetical protein LBT65_08960 [Synergistaceae bacterium]|jgi:hypothetical protein|nr:hypothetical protein [Synergistaceae bacterium]